LHNDHLFSRKINAGENRISDILPGSRSPCGKASAKQAEIVKATILEIERWHDELVFRKSDSYAVNP
jgi:hypothetical protein